MVNLRCRFFDIQENPRHFLRWLGKKGDVIYDIDNGFIELRGLHTFLYKVAKMQKIWLIEILFGQ